MAATHLDLGPELGNLLDELGGSLAVTARELIVMELYRRSRISSGKAADLLAIPREEFIRRAADAGIPYFRFTEDEWRTEIEESKRT